MLPSQPDRSLKAEVEIVNKVRYVAYTISCSVAQAMLLVKATIPVMSARHDQGGAPWVGSYPWTHCSQVVCAPLALLAGQADARDAQIWTKGAHRPPQNRTCRIHCTLFLDYVFLINNLK